MARAPISVRFVLSLVVSAVCGALAGAAAGFTASSLSPQIMIFSSTRTAATSTTQVRSPTSTFAIVPLERRPVEPLLPPAFAKRGVSSVAALYRRPKGTAIEDRLLTDDRLLGQAVALTSDGWLVTDASALGDLHLSEIVIWHEGASIPIDRGVIDHLNGTVFLKTSVSEVPPAAFAHVQDLTPGAELWMETRAGELAPTIALSLSMRTGTDPISSETASRRVGAEGMSSHGDLGGAAWDPNGSLVGLIESAAGERVRLIPASSIATSFASLLANNEIRHAALGVRALDLADVRFDGDRGGLPSSGALVRDDRKTGKPGVAKDSAASKAKLKTGDVILRVDHDILDGSKDLGEVLADYQPGAAVTLRVLRGTSDSDVQVTLGQTVTSEPLK